MPDPEVVPGEAGQGAAGTSPPVSPPATPPEGASPPPPPPASPPEPPKPFYSSLKNAELRGWAETKGYKQSDAGEAFEALATSYRNAEQLLGAPKDQILKLPADLKDAAAMKPVLERIGMAAPEESKGYGFSEIEGIEPARAGALETLIHKHGVPASMAKAVMADIVTFEREQNASQERQEKEEAAIELGKFRAKHGARSDEKIEGARRFVRQLGMNEETLQRMEAQMGVADFLDFFAKAHEQMGEAGFTEGARKQTFDMSPEAAKAEHARLMTDRDFMTKYTGGDLGAREKLSRLNQIMAQGQVRVGGAS